MSTSDAPAALTAFPTETRAARTATWLGLALLALAVLCTGCWRAELIALGPDADSDSYGHHLAARHVLENPHNQAVHWVWLPLFHWLQVPLLALGGDLECVRYANLVLWGLVPLALWGLIAFPGATRGAPVLSRVVPATLAGLVVALCPLGIQLGTTGQPEPLFTLLLLGFCWMQQRQRPLAAGGLLTALVLLRYEAWAVLAASAGWFALRAAQSFRPRHGEGAVPSSHQEFSSRWGGGLVVALPALAILAWAVVRAPFDGGRYFAFLRDTHEFARGATSGSSPHGAAEWLRALTHYALFVAARTLGWGMLALPFGIRRALKEQPWLVLSGCAVLGFVTFGHLTRATLGLDRHLVAVLPLYAALMAFGAVELAALLLRGLRTRAGKPWREAHALQRLLEAGLGLALLWSVYRVAVPWLGNWQHAISERFSAEQAIARYLDAVPRESQIFCDNAIVEGLVRFRPRQVEHGGLESEAFRQRILEASARAVDVYVAGGFEPLSAAHLPGQIVFEAARPPDATERGWDGSATIAVLRLLPR